MTVVDRFNEIYIPLLSKGSRDTHQVGAGVSPIASIVKFKNFIFVTVHLHLFALSGGSFCIVLLNFKGKFRLSLQCLCRIMDDSNDDAI